jgi:pyruvate,water dikinase
VLFDRLRALIGSWLGRDRAAEDRGDGTVLFQRRYHALRLLLAANNEALDTMAEMEQAAGGARPFGMSFVRSRCTAVGVSVFKMVSNLDALAPGSYGELFGVLEEIRHRIQSVLEDRREPDDLPLVAPLERVDGTWAASVGSKMATLGEVAGALGLPVPAGFAITTRAYSLLLEHNDLQPEIDRLIQTSEGDQTIDLFALSSRLRQLVVAAEVPPRLAESIHEAYRNLAAGSTGELTVAVRSSAVGEDSPESSFAGQYRTELNVRQQHLLDAYRQVVASKYSPQAIQYRLERGLRDDQVAMSVGCIAMVDARSGGVAYTGNPGDARDRRVFISSTFGLPKAVVDGYPTDEFVVERELELRVVDRTIVAKRERLAPHATEGVSRDAVDELAAGQPSLSEAEATRVAETALRLEDHFGRPQDVEWAIDEAGSVVVLQSRPLRQLTSTSRSGRPGDAEPPLVEGGVCVSPGAATGPVFRVERDGDALRFPDGAVLVLGHPLPRWAALLGRASAVLAAHGGTAGHLATVARELSLPGLFGVAGLDRLDDGRLVTVDASGRAVYPDEVASLLEDRRPRPSLMAGSPVHEALTAALAHIAPLNLLDPDDVSFRPSSCRTLHDITRFCHEQAVREMFDFGREHRFPKHESKQLHHNVPMQWWVLDLEDGFTREITGKYVRLEEIACRPMLALWRGMVAVPWQGPPAISGKGFASVLFEATANPALATPFRKPYAQRNYFMISKSFMNLQSRFGFHFAAVEAMLGDRDRENYLSFSFKGGAADLARKAARVRLICELLEERGFAVEARQDHATARLAGLPAEAMIDRIEIIGYLIMHTRQLDMVMANPTAVARYRDTIRRDIESLVDDGEDRSGG